MIGKKGKDLVSIPLPQIDIPQFRYGTKGSGGVGQGPGQPGQPLTPGQEPGSGAGDQPGGHILEVELTMEEMASILGEELALPRIEPFWIDTWIKAHYQGVETVYIIHDAVAQEVDEHTFYHTRESGGTKISSAYALADKVINQRYTPDSWNVYAFHFSDGDNWGDDVPH